MAKDKDELLMKYAQKSRKILNGVPKTGGLCVPPWNPHKIIRARNWFGNNEEVQQIIANHYKIDK